MLDLIKPVGKITQKPLLASIRAKILSLSPLSSRWVAIRLMESNCYKFKKNEWFGTTYV